MHSRLAQILREKISCGRINACGNDGRFRVQCFQHLAARKFVVKYQCGHGVFANHRGKCGKWLCICLWALTRS